MNPAGSRNPAGFYWIIPQSRGIEKTRDLVNCIYNLSYVLSEREQNQINVILFWVTHETSYTPI